MPSPLPPKRGSHNDDHEEMPALAGLSDSDDDDKHHEQRPTHNYRKVSGELVHLLSWPRLFAPRAISSHT